MSIAAARRAIREAMANEDDGHGDRNPTIQSLARADSLLASLEGSAPTGKPVLVLCGTGSERENYLDDPAAVYGPFTSTDEADHWLLTTHANSAREDVSSEFDEDTYECELGFWATRDHSLAFLTAPENA